MSMLNVQIYIYIYIYIYKRLNHVHVKRKIVGSNPTQVNFLYGIEKP